MRKIQILAILIIVATSNAANSLSKEEIAKLNSSFSDLFLGENPKAAIAQLAKKFQSLKVEENTVQFLLGFLVEIKPDGTLIDHDEGRICIIPNASLESLTKGLIASALSFAKDTTEYNDYHSKITLLIPAFGDAFISNFKSKCPGNEQRIQPLVDFFHEAATSIDKQLKKYWDDLQMQIQLFFETFTDSINSGNYKHAFANSIVAVNKA